MFKRLLNLIKSWFGAGVSALEDPELLLQQAQEDMRALHAKNRERAVKAITQKNQLQQMVDETQKTVTSLESKAELALKRGDRDLALQLLKEKQSYEQTLQLTRGQLESAIETAEAVKQAIKREEEKIRQKTAEALALKAQWQNSKIQIEMNKALEGMQTIDDTSNAFGRASAKIKQTNSEMLARTELSKGTVNSRIEQLNVAEGDLAAENELAALESKLGLTSTTVAPTATKTETDTSVMSELERLEARIGGNGSGSSSG
jgi:phage shock protein A